MSVENLTKILIYVLAFSVVLLFIFVVVFLIVWFKGRKEKQEEKKNEEKTKMPEKKEEKQKYVKTNIYTAENIKKFLDFDEIKDNMIIQNGGKKIIMVIGCDGINYDLMSSIEKVSIEQGFVQFLNTLTKPIQIYIQTRKVNLTESIANYNKRFKNIERDFNKIKLQYEQAQSNPDISDEQFNKIRFEYIRQKNLTEYTQDIIANTEKMSLNKNILTKKYYIAIHYFPENTDGLFNKEELFDMAFSELYTSAQSIIRTISMCGIDARILDSTELAELLYIAYNRDESETYGVDKAIKAGYDALYTTAPDAVNKKISELDKLIEKRSTELANDTIEYVIYKDKKQKELELREKEFDQLVRKMAKNKINENKDYIGKEVAEQSIEEISKIEEQSTKKTKR